MRKSSKSTPRVRRQASESTASEKPAHETSASGQNPSVEGIASQASLFAGERQETPAATGPDETVPAGAGEAPVPGSESAEASGEADPRAARPRRARSARKTVSSAAAAPSGADVLPAAAPISSGETEDAAEPAAATGSVDAGSAENSSVPANPPRPSAVLASEPSSEPALTSPPSSSARARPPGDPAPRQTRFVATESSVHESRRRDPRPVADASTPAIAPAVAPLASLTPALAVVPQLLLRAQGVRVAFFDVDGVLTDGSLYFGAEGETLKRFNTLDGHGIKLLARAGITPAVVTGRDSPALRVRLAALGVTHVRYGTEDKKPAAEAILAELGLTWSQAAWIGDDWPDLPALRRCAFACAPANAHAEVKAVAHHVTRLAGGEGAAREYCDLLLVASGRYVDLLQEYAA